MAAVPQQSPNPSSSSSPGETCVNNPISDRSLFVKAFYGLLLRDLRVISRELAPFLLRVGMQPLLFLFVFTYIMPRMAGGSPMASTAGPGFGTVLLPGLMAVAIMFCGIAAVALPLSTEFGSTREIDDRVMCPVPVAAVALEKVVFSALQSIVAAGLVIPMAIWIPASPVYPDLHRWPLMAIVLVLSSLLAGALGLAIGSSVSPRHIGLVFSILVVPITFLGCVYYPWAYLDKIRWLQIAVLLNPIVYICEGLRSAVTPQVHSMPVWIVLPALVVFLAILGRLGLRAFLRRVIS